MGVGAPSWTEQSHRISPRRSVTGKPAGPPPIVRLVACDLGGLLKGVPVQSSRLFQWEERESRAKLPLGAERHAPHDSIVPLPTRFELPFWS